MNLSKATSRKIKNPFIKNKQLTIYAHDEKGKIKSFEVVLKGVAKVFPVKKNDILGAWQMVEKFCNNI